MNEKFFDLKKEKQDRMINAALKVFAKNGYRHASTDNIVAEAGISKGLLFHYFINKLGLYTFVFDYSVRFMSLELTTRVKKTQEDYFVQYEKIETAKLHVLKNYPYMQVFLDSIAGEDVQEALLAVHEKKEVLKELKDGFLKEANTDMFKKGIDKDSLERILGYTIKGMMEERFLSNTFQADMLQEEITAYLSMMKGLICSSYKENQPDSLL